MFRLAKILPQKMMLRNTAKKVGASFVATMGFGTALYTYKNKFPREDNVYKPLVYLLNPSYLEKWLGVASLSATIIALRKTNSKFALPLAIGFNAAIAATLFHPTLIYFPMEYSIPSLKYLKNKNFSQGVFNNKVRSFLPELEFNKSGTCYGHMRMWHHCLNQKQDYLSELDKIDLQLTLHKNDTIKNLTSDQYKLLQHVSKIQKHHSAYDISQSICAAEYHKITVVRCGQTMDNASRLSSLGEILNAAIASPNELMMIAVSEKRLPSSMHCIGLCVKTNNDLREFHIFDPNCGEKTFDTKQDAKIYLSHLIAYAYGVRFKELFASDNSDKNRLKMR